MSQKIEVLEFIQTLPQNRVTTYKALALKFHTHPRAIASYMRSNKDLKKYPCYKVVAHDGSLNGYILGAQEKRKKILNDNIFIDKRNKVEERYIIRHFS